MSVVTDVSVTPSSQVTEIGEGALFDSDWESVEPQSSSFSQNRADSQEEMRYEKRLRPPEEE